MLQSPFGLGGRIRTAITGFGDQRNAIILHRDMSGRRDSNPLRQLGRLSPLPGEHPHILVLNVGFELTTYRLQGGCSTTELIQHNC